MFKGQKRHKTIKCRLGKLQQSFSNLAFTERPPGQSPDKKLIYHQIDFNYIIFLLLTLAIIRVCLTMNSPCESWKLSLIARLNSGNFWILNSSESIPVIYRVLKSIKNDIKNTLFEIPVIFENSILDDCVGVCAGES